MLELRTVACRIDFEHAGPRANMRILIPGLTDYQERATPVLLAVQDPVLPSRKFVRYGDILSAESRQGRKQGQDYKRKTDPGHCGTPDRVAMAVPTRIGAVRGYIL